MEEREQRSYKLPKSVLNDIDALERHYRGRPATQLLGRLNKNDIATAAIARGLQELMAEAGLSGAA